MLTPLKGHRKVTVESGGLEDNDIDQARPNFPPSPVPLANVHIKFPIGLQCDTSRKNEVNHCPSLMKVYILTVSKVSQRKFQDNG